MPKAQKQKCKKGGFTPYPLDSRFLHVFTDGACTGNGTAEAKAGCGVWWANNKAKAQSVKLPGEKQTNQRAELYAAILALRQYGMMPPGTKTLKLHSDSRYVIKGITEWFPGWKRDKITSKANLDLFEALDEVWEACGRGRVMWVKVKGHAGIEGNEQADKLARAAIGEAVDGEVDNLIEVQGDLLDSKATFLVHQTNCITNDPKGLSAQVFLKFPYANVYRLRMMHSTPGSLDLRGNGLTQRYVVNLMGQKYPGDIKPYESGEMREQWFESALSKLQVWVRKIPFSSVAVPYKIGCGLAGGDWDKYTAMLKRFAMSVKGHKVFIVRRPGDQ